MVELPLDDAATRYQEVAAALAELTISDSYSDLDGAAAAKLREIRDGFNDFLERSAEALTEQAGHTRSQHEADEDLRDNSLPVPEIEQLERDADRLENAVRAAAASGSLSAFGGQGLLNAAKEARAQADHERQRRNSVLARHTESAQTHAPLLRMDPPPLPSAMAAPGWAGAQGTRANRGGGGATAAQRGTSQGGGAGSSMSPGAGGGSLGGSSGSVSDADVSTETSADGLGAGLGGAQAPMMAQPMTQPMAGQQPYGVQPQTPYGTGSIAPGGMLSSDPKAAGRYDPRRRNKDRKTELTGAGTASMGGALAATFGPGGAVDRGISVSGVTTKADTSGLGTSLSGANGQKPGDGGRGPGGGMMRGGMVPMGPMGSGSQGGGTTKERPDIKPLIKDRNLHGFDSIEKSVEAGIISRATSETPDEQGLDRFLNPDAVREDKDKEGGAR